MTKAVKKASARRPSVKRRQQAFLEAYDKSLSNVSMACKVVGISRNAFYEWCKKYPKFNQQIIDFDESNIDFAETMLMKNIREQKEASIFFYLKTKAKARGYVERQEFEHGGSDAFIEAMKVASKLRRQMEGQQADESN
ncbi:MAG: hypothetical protein K0B15_07340 [Lentimicrobium sp.]|nr:hypothetical protein [Lentimicrobium sp.]